ncbi:hypothetical protein CPB86DRAFT_792829 [Serendipita vermifera]|nr:hypothetical protein CPB86DRAFT_792829 [Serendipita vermifera]
MSLSPSATVTEKGTLPHTTTQPLPPHVRRAEDILTEHGVDIQTGLSNERAARLLAEHGLNQIKPPQPPSKLKILLAQMTNAMTIVLLGAMAVSLGTKDWIAAGVIGALVILNVSVGFTQEWKAEKVLAALASVGSPLATVIRHDPKQNPHKSRGVREGKALTIPTEQVVVGDIITIKIGDVVPADARIIPGQISNLECDESLLTGESLPAAKTSEPLPDANCPVGDRTNMVYSGSQVTKGRAKCIVTMTGMDTELGKIAEALDKKEGTKETGYRLLVYRVKVALGLTDTTPLQLKMNKLAYWLLLVAVVLAVIVVSSTGYRDIPWSIATYAVAAAISALPASLFAVVSLTLAVACRELAARNALVRRMDAVETIGGVHDICSDKTGTITVGRMIVKKVWIPVNAAFVRAGKRADYDIDRGQTYTVESGRDPYFPRGVIRAVGEFDQSPTPNSNDANNDEYSDDVNADDIIRIESLEPAFQEFVHAAALNNMATIHKGTEEKGWDAHGDPTEIALQVFAHKAGRGKPHLTTVRRRAHNYPYGEPLGRMVSRASANIHSQTQLKQTQTVDSDGPLVTAVDGHYELLVEHPFDSTIKRMSTMNGLTWHWGLVIGQLVLYLVVAELYKLSKRTYYRRRAAKRMNPVEVLEKRKGVKFHVAYTIDA